VSLDDPNAAVPIVVVAGESGVRVAADDEAAIRRLVRDRLLAARPESYRKVQVEVERSAAGVPCALLVSMLRAQTYTADVVRLEVDPQFRSRTPSR
jgi:hypothetical protein